MNSRKSRIAVAALLVLALFGGVATLLTSSGGRTNIVGYFDNADGIYPGDDVVVLGVAIGKVDKIVSKGIVRETDGYSGFAATELADDLRAHGGRLGKFDGGLALGRAGDEVDLVGAILTNGRRHLPEPVHHFFLDLGNHVGVAEMDLADVDAAERVAPLR